MAIEIRCPKCHKVSWVLCCVLQGKKNYFHTNVDYDDSGKPIAIDYSYDDFTFDTEVEDGYYACGRCYAKLADTDEEILRLIEEDEKDERWNDEDSEDA